MYALNFSKIFRTLAFRVYKFVDLLARRPLAQRLCLRIRLISKTSSKMSGPYLDFHDVVEGTVSGFIEIICVLQKLVGVTRVNG